jgi:thiol-disulfide isomerase/thioredoxin
MTLRVSLLATLLGAVSLFAADATIGAVGPKLKFSDPAGKSIEFTPGKELTVVTFISTQCPISNDYNDRMSAVYKDYTAKGVKFYFLNANSTEPMNVMLEHKKSAGFPFEVYKDETAADLLGAQVTPESFVYDKAGKLVYHGYIDDARNPARIQTNGLRDALDATLAGKPVTNSTTKAFGCTIKRARKS